MKIVDKINASVAAGKTFFSFEFFPPRTEEVRCSSQLCVLANNDAVSCRLCSRGAVTADEQHRCRQRRQDAAPPPPPPLTHNAPS